MPTLKEQLEAMTDEELNAIILDAKSDQELLSIVAEQPFEPPSLGERAVEFGKQSISNLIKEPAKIAESVGFGVTQISPLVGGPEIDPGEALKFTGETAKKTAVAPLSILDKEEFAETPFFEAVGDVVGGAAGVTGGAAVGAPVKGGIAGSGLGGFIGRLIDDEIRFHQGTLTPEELSFKSRMESAGEAGVLSMIAEGIPEIFKPVIGRVLAPFKGSMSKRAKEALEFFRLHGDEVEEVFGQRNILPFLPSEATDIQVGSSTAKALDVFGNIIEKSVLGGGPITSRRIGVATVNQKVLGKMLDSIDSLNLEAKDIGELIRKAAEDGRAYKNGAINRLYTTIKENTEGLTRKILLKGEELDPLSLTFKRKEKEVPFIRVTKARKIAEKVEEMGRSIRKIGDPENGFTISEQAAAALRENNDHLTFEQAQKLRSTYGSILANRKFKRELGDANNLLKDLVRTLDESIEEGLRKRAPKELARWKQAKKLRTQLGKTFDNDLIQELIGTAEVKTNTSAKDFIDKFIGVGDGLDLDRMTKIKSAVKEADWLKLKRFITQKMLLDSAELAQAQRVVSTGALGKETGEFITLLGEKLEKNLQGKGGMGEGLIKFVYNKEERKTLEGVANALVLSQQKQADGTGGMFIQLTQGGAVLGVGGLKKAGTVLFGPKILSWLFLNPRASKWLTEGLSAPSGSGIAVRSFNKLSAAILAQENKERNRRKKSRNRRLELFNR